MTDLMTDQELLDKWELRIAKGCDEETARKIDALLARVEALQKSWNQKTGT